MLICDYTYFRRGIAEVSSHVCCECMRDSGQRLLLLSVHVAGLGQMCMHMRASKQGNVTVCDARHASSWLHVHPYFLDLAAEICSCTVYQSCT